MITPKAYFMGRDVAFPDELTDALRAHAAETIARVNMLLSLAANVGVQPAIEPYVASGWRPKAINEHTSNAAGASRHITCEAIDLHDTKPGRPLARWCLANPAKLEAVGLWMEDPRWCWREKENGEPWVHLQTVAPASGHRVYIPSSAPATAAALAEPFGQVVELPQQGGALA
jgi:hypothetical protein